MRHFKLPFGSFSQCIIEENQRKDDMISFSTFVPCDGGTCVKERQQTSTHSYLISFCSVKNPQNNCAEIVGFKSNC